ncbi:MAG: FAD-binding protein [Clostridia bacterium]|nr:FAD-binding protein [Clostridia bacterium]
MIYDLAIIGAGPAGATLARELGRTADLNILLVDGIPDGGSKVCGGLLSEDAQELLAKMGLTLPRSVLEEEQIFAVDTIDLVRRMTVTYGRSYLNMDRGRFDRWLISLIPERVSLLEARCTGIEKADGIFRLTLSKNSEKSEIQARMIVGADGASSIVRRTLYKERKIKKFASIQEWYRIKDARLPDYSCIFDKETSPSCSWTVRKGEYLVFGGAFESSGCRGAFDRQKERLEDYLGVKLGEPEKKEACLVCSPRGGRDMITGEGGAYLVGEAAGFISASSFEGISSAMLSGKLLAEAIAEGDDDSTIARAYQKKTAPLRRKLLLKIPKMRILTSPTLRYLIMKSGVTSIKKY